MILSDWLDNNDFNTPVLRATGDRIISSHRLTGTKCIYLLFDAWIENSLDLSFSFYLISFPDSSVYRQ